MKEGEATVEVVRVSWVHARTGIVKKETVVAKGKLHPPEGDGKRWVRKGSVDLGEGGKEVTWESDFVGVSYVIRATLQSITPHTTWTATQPIELTTHEWIGESALAMPALSLPAVERTALHLINISL